MPTRLATFRKEPKRLVNTFWTTQGRLLFAAAVQRSLVTLVERFPVGPDIVPEMVVVPIRDLTSPWCEIKFVGDADFMSRLRPRSFIRYSFSGIWVLRSSIWAGIEYESYASVLRRFLRTLDPSQLQNYAMTAASLPTPVSQKRGLTREQLDHVWASGDTTLESRGHIQWSSLPQVKPITPEHPRFLREHKRIVAEFFANAEKPEPAEKPDEPTPPGPSVWEHITEDEA